MFLQNGENGLVASKSLFNIKDAVFKGAYRICSVIFLLPEKFFSMSRDLFLHSERDFKL